MLRKVIIGFLLAMATSGNPVLAESDPSLPQVYAVAKAGRLDEAKRMMDQVLKDHPNSAKAHFVEAEILAQQGNLKEAATQLNQAERLEPGVPFADKRAVQQLESKIANEQAVTRVASNISQPAVGYHLPWGMLLLGIGAIAVIFSIIRAMNSRRVLNLPMPYQPTSQGAPGTFMPTYGQGGIGSGIMSGLATGAAVGAGMVAGEALAHHFMDGSSASGTATTEDHSGNSWGASSSDLGGADFGIADASSWDDGSGFADLDGDNDWS